MTPFSNFRKRDMMDAPKEIEEQGKNETMRTNSSPNKHFFLKSQCLPVSFLHRAMQSDHPDYYIFSRLHLPLASWVRSGDVPMLSNWPSWAIAIPMAVIPCDPHLRSLHCSPVNLDTSWANIGFLAFKHWVKYRCMVKIWWSDVIFHFHQLQSSWKN